MLDTLEPAVFQNAFRKSGLCPFDKDQVGYSRIMRSVTGLSSENMDLCIIKPVPASKASDRAGGSLELIESSLSSSQIQNFRNNIGKLWNGPIEDQSLYYLWKKLSAETYVRSPKPIIQSVEIITDPDFLSKILGERELIEFEVDNEESSNFGKEFYLNMHIPLEILINLLPEKQYVEERIPIREELEQSDTNIEKPCPVNESRRTGEHVTNESSDLVIQGKFHK